MVLLVLQIRSPGDPSLLDLPAGATVVTAPAIPLALSLPKGLDPI